MSTIDRYYQNIYALGQLPSSSQQSRQNAEEQTQNLIGQITKTMPQLSFEPDGFDAIGSKYLGTLKLNLHSEISEFGVYLEFLDKCIKLSIVTLDSNPQEILNPDTETGKEAIETMRDFCQKLLDSSLFKIFYSGVGEENISSVEDAQKYIDSNQDLLIKLSKA